MKRQSFLEAISRSRRGCGIKNPDGLAGVARKTALPGRTVCRLVSIWLKIRSRSSEMYGALRLYIPSCSMGLGGVQHMLSVGMPAFSREKRYSLKAGSKI